MEGTAASAVNDAPASSGSPSPATFAEAFASDASPASGHPDQTTTPSAAEQPTSAQESTLASDDRSPFIPRPRFDEVNSRLKAAESWKQQYAWAEKVQQADLQQAIAIAQRAQSDPIGYVQELITDLQNHPVHAQTLRSLAAKALAAGRGQAQPAAMPEPDVAITDTNGNVVGHTYSEKALAARDQFLAQQLLAKVDEKYAPVVKTHEQMVAEREQLQREASAKQFASGFMQELKTYPNFEQHKQAIGQDVKRQLDQLPANDPRADDPAFLEAVTLRAYNRVVVPTLQAATQSKVLDSLKQKAHASTAVNPSSAAPSAPAAYKSFKDLPPEMWK